MRVHRLKGAHFFSADLFALLYKLHWLLVSPVGAVSRDELVSALPSVDEMYEIACGGMDWSAWNTLYGNRANSFIIAAQACEKYQLYDQALIYAETQKIPHPQWQKGFPSPSGRFEAFRISGRCLAALGKTQEAEEAFKTASASVEGFGYPLLKVLAIADLKVHILDKASRGDEGSTLLKGSVQALLGDTPDPQQVKELDSILGPEISLCDVLA